MAVHGIGGRRGRSTGYVCPAPDGYWVFSDSPGAKISIRFQNPKSKVLTTIPESPKHTDVVSALLAVLSEPNGEYTRKQMLQIARNLEGHLTATIHGTEQDLAKNSDLVEILEQKVGRLVFNGFPTGVEVSHAVIHGGPFPATWDGRSTSVGSMAILRFTRPVCFQGFPNEALPAELQDSNPLKIWRMIDGKLTRERI